MLILIGHINSGNMTGGSYIIYIIYIIYILYISVFFVIYLYITKKTYEKSEWWTTFLCTTRTAYGAMPPILSCRGNVFTQLLSSNDNEINRLTPVITFDKTPTT